MLPNKRKRQMCFAGVRKEIAEWVGNHLPREPELKMLPTIHRLTIRRTSRSLICTQPNLSPPTLISGWGSDTLALQSYDIIALRLHFLLAPDRNVSMRAG
jgi:hypothetical protein